MYVYIHICYLYVCVYMSDTKHCHFLVAVKDEFEVFYCPFFCAYVQLHICRVISVGVFSSNFCYYLSEVAF